MNELPTIGDLRDAINTLDHARERRDLPSREHLRQWQAAIVNFWHVTQRFHAQAEALEVLNGARLDIFKRPALNAGQVPRLYVTRRTGQRRSSLDFHPSRARISLQLLCLPGAANYLAKIATALDAELPSIKALHKEHFREARRVAA